MYFKQIQQHGDNFSYIIADEDTGDGAVVDSSYNAGKITQLIEEQKLNLKFIINTHGHSDHIAALYDIHKETGAAVAVHRADAKMMGGRGDSTHVEFGPHQTSNKRRRSESRHKVKGL